MNKMRLTRDKKWFFQHYPYHQMHMDNELLHGWVSINYLNDGENRYWDYKIAGRTQVCGEGMLWLTIIPDDRSRCIGCYILPNRRVSTWYIDVIDSVGIDDDGVVYYIDKYLDVLLTPQGDVEVKDSDELDEAYASGDISKQQYEDAIKEGELIISELATDIKATEAYCLKVLDLAEEMIGDDRFTIFLDIDGVLDVYDPQRKLQELIPDAVGYLKNLAHRTAADVVIISDWRYGSPSYRDKAATRGFSRQIEHWNLLESTLTAAGIPIVGVTPWEDTIPNRTGEIKQYLAEHPNIKRYVILDDCYGDDYSSDPQIRSHLVFIDALKGLQMKDLMVTCDIMNRLK